MRSLEECKTEIFRRSEERIQQRKKIQKRIVMTSLFLFLAAGTYGSVSLSGKKSANMSLEKEENNVIWETQFSSANKVASYDLLEITSNEYQQKIVDTEEVMRIYEKICYVCDTKIVDSLEIKEELKEEVEESPQEAIEDDSQIKKYTIIFSNKDGEQVSYIFMENELWNEKSGEGYKLTEIQSLELKSILYIK